MFVWLCLFPIFSVVVSCIVLFYSVISDERKNIACWLIFSFFFNTSRTNCKLWEYNCSNRTNFTVLILANTRKSHHSLICTTVVVLVYISLRLNCYVVLRFITLKTVSGVMFRDTTTSNECDVDVKRRRRSPFTCGSYPFPVTFAPWIATFPS